MNRSEAMDGLMAGRRALALLVVSGCLAAAGVGAYVKGVMEGPVGGGAAPAMLIDVNSADAATLALLPGIGPALAGRIIEERERGAFGSVEELQRVSGIGPAVSAGIGPYVRFGPGERQE